MQMIPKKTYFTLVNDPSAGLIDCLNQIETVRKLGLSLGYVYIYRRPADLRNTGIMMPLTLPWFLAKKVNRVYRWFVRNHPSIYDHLGLTEHFSREAKAERHPALTECKKVNIVLGDHVLKEQGITSLDGLQRWIKEIVSRESLSDRPLVVSIRLTHPLSLLRAVARSIPDPIDDLNLRAIYSEHHRTALPKSRFPEQGLKTLMHIRLGDAAPVRTPWKTWIGWVRIPWIGEERQVECTAWHEYRNESEFPQLTVADFYGFIQGLSTRFDDNAFALQIFSDGFERTFSRILSDNNHPRRGSSLGLLRKQLKALLNQRKRYAREFKPLKKVKNSVSTIGETPGKLTKLIDAVATANLLIVAFPSQMMAFRLMGRPSSSTETPPAVLLHKSGWGKQLRDFLKDNPSRKIIPVDVSAPDFDDVAVRLVELFPQLAPLLRSPNSRS